MVIVSGSMDVEAGGKRDPISMIVSGIATILQARTKGPVGSGYLCPVELRARVHLLLLSPQAKVGGHAARVRIAYRFGACSRLYCPASCGTCALCSLRSDWPGGLDGGN